LRTPISRVRSVTEIIMMAITPMPPTISATEEITTSARNTARLIWSQSRRMASWPPSSKSFGSSSFNPCRMRMISSTSVAACSRVSVSSGTMVIVALLPPPKARRALVLKTT
jgi:hypothetical protein